MDILCCSKILTLLTPYSRKDGVISCRPWAEKPILLRNNCVQIALTRICESNQYLQSLAFTDVLQPKQNL